MQFILTKKIKYKSAKEEFNANLKFLTLGFEPSLKHFSKFI